MIRKAVILAGGEDAKLAPLTKFYSPWMLPVLNEPLIGYTIDFLKRNGIEDVVVTLRQKGEIPNHLVKGTGVNILYNVEDRPRGTAGAIKDVEGFICKEPFLVVNSNLFIGHADLNEFIRFHFDTDSIATVGVSRTGGNGIREDIRLGSDRSIEGFHRDYSLMDKETQWRSSGIYIFDPYVFKFIDENNYMDIKEQLIPVLLKESLNVFASEVEGFHLCINSTDDYINAHRGVLLKDDYISYLNGKEEIEEGVWAGRNVVISPNAYLLGPVIIGNDSNVESGAQIIGPSSIGNRCQISEGTLIRESILWDGVALSKDARVEYSIIGESSDVPHDYHIRNMIVMDGLRTEDVNLIPSDFSIKAAADLSGIMSKAAVRQIIYRAAKRILDITLSAAGIVLLLPLFLLITLLIKTDSAGPVFYIQNRCGIRGKLFNMIKFRTMVEDAEKLHKELISRNELDGPVFKMFNDPRVTRVGNILRKTSLDEIPQLVNVLKGEMSLVGPRPLITDEMKFSSTWRNTRLKVKPGITGLWQIQGRSESPFHDWIRYDVYYVKNQSFWLDIKILFKTIGVVLRKIGAY